MATLVISASLQSPVGDVQTDTGRLAEPGYYVIVGWGVTALYNHLTLIDRQKKWGQPDDSFDADKDWGTQRLSAAKSGGPARLPVMHIGFPEPWQRRRGERMGQWPRMLNFFRGMGSGYIGIENADGYSTAGSFQKNWLPSRVFADGLSKVHDYIDEQYKYSHVQRDHSSSLTRGSAPIATTIIWESGFVGVIEKQSSPLVRDGSFGATPNSADSWEKRLWDRVTKYWAGNRTWRDGQPDATFQGAWKNTACPYRISVYRQLAEGNEALSLRYVYAHKIDICTGPGQPRIFGKTQFEDTSHLTAQQLWDRHLPEWATPPSWRSRTRTKVIDGNEYIGYGNSGADTAIVFKGNPVGAQSVQSALDMPELRESQRVGRVWFISNKDLRKDEANVPGDRNLLEVVGNSQLDIGPKRDNETLRIRINHGTDWTEQSARNTAFRNRLFRLSSHEISKISATETGIRCALTLQGRNTIPAADANQAVAELLACCDGTPPGCEVTGVDPNRRVTRVDGSYMVYSQGQDRDATTCGSVAFMTRRFTDLKFALDASTGFPFMVTDGAQDAEVAALETTPETGGLRILGSGMMNSFAGWTTSGGLHFDPKDFPTRDTNGFEVDAANSPAKSQAGTIPREGPAGGGGLNVNIPNIWRANRHFGKGLASINTASFYELQTAGLSPFIARWIVAVRTRTDRGFSWDEYMEMLRAVDVVVAGKSQKQREQLGLQGIDSSALIYPERFKF